MNELMIKPPPLRAGDGVALLALADRPQGSSEVQRAAALVTQLGFLPLLYGVQEGRYGAWSAPDKMRASFLMQAWHDERVRAIWLLRSGWGAARLLSLLDYAAFAARPKILIANGEASSLLIAIHQRTGLVVLHGPELARCRLDVLTRSWILQLLTRSQAPDVVPQRSSDPFDHSAAPVAFTEGCAEGQLIGGNLIELASLLGTPDTPQLDGKLLFVALPQAAPYVLERHLTALRLAGLLQRCAGLVISDYSEIRERRANGLTYEEALRYGLKTIQQPTYVGLPLGEGTTTLALPLGVHAALDTRRGTLRLSEGMVAQ